MTGISITNPHAGFETEDGWTMGFAWGFMSPSVSTDPPLVIAPELFDAFNEGVLVGQQGAIEGLAVNTPCISLQQHASEEGEALMEGFHLLEVAGLIRSVTHLAHFGSELFVSVFLLMIPGPPPLDPISEFEFRAQRVRDQLGQLGISEGKVYFGAGIDENVGECELQFTPVFCDIDAARTAVTAQGRPGWVLAEWDAGAPMSGGGFTIIETS